MNTSYLDSKHLDGLAMLITLATSEVSRENLKEKFEVMTLHLGNDQFEKYVTNKLDNITNPMAIVEEFGKFYNIAKTILEEYINTYNDTLTPENK